MHSTIRLTDVQIMDFRNIEYAKVVFPTRQNGSGAYGMELIGLYGRCGSGKTAVVEALQLIRKCLIAPRTPIFPKMDLVRQGEQESFICAAFHVQLDCGGEIEICHAKYIVRLSHFAMDYAAARGELRLCFANPAHDTDLLRDAVRHELTEYAQKKLIIADGLRFDSPVMMKAQSDSLFGRQYADYWLVERRAEKINFLLKELVPDVQLGVRDRVEGEKRFSEIVTLHGDAVVPLGKESTGIRKLVWLFDLLLRVANDPSVCLVVDNIDAGLGDYLLGQLFYALCMTGKGQLLFTSSSLRPMEMLEYKNAMVATTNAENRFIHLPEDRRNCRSNYLRHAMLGGADEKLSDDVDANDLGRAFRRAAKI